MQLATIRVDLKEDDAPPEAKLDEGEHIVKRLVDVDKRASNLRLLECTLDPDKTVYDTLLELSKDDNIIVDARLLHVACPFSLQFFPLRKSDGRTDGLHLGKQLTANSRT